jgi:hypothetical protein
VTAKVRRGHTHAHTKTHEHKSTQKPCVSQTKRELHRPHFYTRTCKRSNPRTHACTHARIHASTHASTRAHTYLLSLSLSLTLSQYQETCVSQTRFGAFSASKTSESIAPQVTQVPHPGSLPNLRGIREKKESARASVYPVALSL